MQKITEIYTENATFDESGRKVKNISFGEKMKLARVRRKEANGKTRIIVAGYNDSAKTFITGYLKYMLSFFKLF